MSFKRLKLVRRGMPLPYGAHGFEQGVNFAFFSRNATRVRLELFDHPNDKTATLFFDLDPIRNRTGDVWHIWLKDICPGQLYAYRVDGPYQLQKGHRFNFNKLLLDPFATAIAPLKCWDFHVVCGADLSTGQDFRSMSDDSQAMSKCVFMYDHFDWCDDQPLRYPWSKIVIYETHVRGLTVNPNAEVTHPGTFCGLIEKIPYLKALGITAIELMPIHEFNDFQISVTNPQTGKPLKNYWGYDPVAFFAPKASYSSSGGLGQQTLEFKKMVLSLHEAGIEVILDIVFNHTAEGNERGPTFCFRGIENAIFYMLEDDKRYYKDYTGTGNTINANHPVVRDYILSVLRYWVVEMHIDGFRFDLASILSRDQSGNLLKNSPLLEQIAEDPILSHIKLIAEAWDVGGAYQLGSFSGVRWSEWNSRYRDDIRCFWRGDEDKLGLFANRLCGSADIYAKSGKTPANSINFVSCHDGFTLHDLVSYRQKHNEENGQNNHDGAQENFSDNYGMEGATDNAAIESIRKRQIKNFLVTLFVSRGVPMLLGGDEFCRTQQGNNNAYCQDNGISWYDWDYLKKHPEIYRFTRGMISFRKAHSVLTKEQFYTDNEINWFNPQGGQPNWNDRREKKLACLIDEDSYTSLYLMFNASTDEIDFVLPALPKKFAWYLAVDTGRISPQDLLAEGEEMRLENATTYHLTGRASAILLGQSVV